MIFRTITSLAFLLITLNVFAQSKTTEALEKKFVDTRTFFFYKNTLRMLNQTEDKDFDELIKDIEKMKLLLINKEANNIDGGYYKKLVSEYKSDRFEEVMTSRFEGKNFDIFFKGSDQKTEGMLVLINDETSLYVLDILGKINVNKVTKLYKTMGESSDLSQFFSNAAKAGAKKKETRDNE